MALAAQMNIRIEPELKKAGDAALADIGLTPTQAVRLVWEKAASRGKGLEELQELLIEGEEKAAAEDLSEHPLLRAFRRTDEFFASLGVGEARETYEEPGYKELKERVVSERMLERGLI